jgi:hypothetical protein
MKTVSVPALFAPARSATPNLLGYWHLLSLDAPTVAAVWTVFVSRAVHVALPLYSPCAMFLAVWMIYACDRLMDARRQHNLEARHRFHGRHRTGFYAALALAALAMLPLIAAMPARSRHAYLALGGLLLLWLALIHFVTPMRRLPKELVVGFFFSAAVFIPTLSRTWMPGLILPAIVFANLCSLNCLFIYAWEHPQRSAPHATTAFGLRRLREIALASIVLPLVAIPFTGTPVLLAAASLSAIALLQLHQRQAHIDRTSLRAAADLALLTPIPLLLLLR